VQAELQDDDYDAFLATLSRSSSTSGPGE
jgi:hypothetical protein